MLYKRKVLDELFFYREKKQLFMCMCVYVLSLRAAYLRVWRTRGVGKIEK